MAFSSEIIPGDDFEQVYCPECKTTTNHEIRESLNFGNLIAICDKCECEHPYTEIDHKEILRSARRGW